MLNPNYTLFIQIANFLFLVFMLNILLYRPIRGILAQREQKIGSLEQSVADLKNRSEASQTAIKESSAQAQKEGFSEKAAIKAQAAKEEQAILQEAAAAMEQRLAKAVADIEAKVQEARKVLEQQAGIFSKDLAEKVLGRAV